MRVLWENGVFFLQIFQDGALEEELGRNSHTDSILLRKIWEESYTVS